MPRLRCSFFRGVRDPHPRHFTGTWSDLKKRLDVTHHPRPGSVGEEAKKSLPAISGTRFRPGASRSRSSALDLSLLLFDIDNAREVPTGDYWVDPRTGLPSDRPKLRKERIPEPVTFPEVLDALWTAGVDAYVWTTWSHTPEWPRLRVVVPLAQPVPAHLWESATEWAVDRLGFVAIRRGVDLPVLQDTARLNFLPGGPRGTPVLRGETIGEHLNIPLDRLRSVDVPKEAATPYQETLLVRRATLNGAEVQWWKAYRVNGRPVDFGALDLASMMRSRGLWVGTARDYLNGTRWRCTCPFAHEHTGGRNDDSAVVIQIPGRWPSFHCSHSHHAQLGLRDVIELFWGRP